MNAPKLLAEVAARGATARVETDASGVVMLVVNPRGAIADLLPDIARFKPQLLELLATPDVQLCPTLQRDINSARRRLIPGLSRLICDKDALDLANKLDLLDQRFDIE